MDNVAMIVDWKLPGSGEFEKWFDIRLMNLQAMCETEPDHAVKFVVKDSTDWFKAMDLYYKHRDSMYDLIWYVGRVWDSQITNAQLVENIMAYQLPWRLNVQLHNYIWDPQERGR